MTEAKSDPLLQALHRVLAGHDLDEATAEAAMAEIMAGEAPDARIGGYLVALRMKGETAAEIAGSVRAMRSAATMIRIDRAPLVDTCGTGGDSSGTFNISTGAALVAAAAGVTIAKHGNRSVSSKCGSADVLAELGIPVDVESQRAKEIVERHGFVFLFAPRFHGAIRHAMGARTALATRTIFNALGPLANPAGATRQVMGVYSPALLELAAEALRLLGVERAFVVHASDGLDEITITGTTEVVEVHRGELTRSVLAPSDFGVERADANSLAGGDAVENAAILEGVFGGEKGPRRDIIVMNAGMALVAGDLAAGPREGAEMAAAAIDEGRVGALVEALRAETP